MERDIALRFLVSLLCLQTSDADSGDKNMKTICVYVVKRNLSLKHHRGKNKVLQRIEWICLVEAGVSHVH